MISDTNTFRVEQVLISQTCRYGNARYNYLCVTGNIALDVCIGLVDDANTDTCCVNTACLHAYLDDIQ